MVQYRDIPDFPGYRVGDDGSVWCCRPRNGKGGAFGPWRQMRLQKGTKEGHLRVRLYRGKDEGHNRWVHRLVLEAFVGPCPEGMEARHFPDRNPANNALSNLCWGTPAQNQADRKVQGTELRGEKNPAAKIDARVVKAVRADALAGVSQKEIARRNGLSQTHVSRIIKRLRWAHV